jgi:arylsulfatase A-like enzyme
MGLPARSFAGDQPNIILILADDYGYGDLGCYGSERFKTPALDSLAERGVRFTDFHSNGTVCSPTRAALMTGRYQQRSGINGVVTAADHRHTGLALEEITFAEVLKTHGYTTGIFGKWHLGYDPAFSPVRQGFDEFIGYVSGNVDYHSHVDQVGIADWWKQNQLSPEEGYTTDLITGHGVDFIRRHKDKPFLLYLPHEAAHGPWQGRSSEPLRAPGNARLRTNKLTLEIYKEMIEVMDEGVGRVVQAVEESGLTEKTFIIFFSDNGPAGLGSAGSLRGRKASVFEGGHRVAAIACWPGRIKAGGVSDILSMGADLFPTMAAAAGAQIPDQLKLDGVNLLPYLCGKEPAPERAMFWGWKNQLVVRKGHYKLICTTQFTQPQLYDLNNDLGEQNNIAEAHPERTNELLTMIKAWHTDVSSGVEPRS